MKIGDSVEVIQGNYSGKTGVIRELNEDIVLVQGEGLEGAARNHKPIPNARYFFTYMIQVI